MLRCHTNTDAKAAIQRTVKSVLWEEKKVGIHRLMSRRWPWNRHGGSGVEVSTIGKTCQGRGESELSSEWGLFGNMNSSDVRNLEEIRGRVLERERERGG